MLLPNNLHSPNGNNVEHVDDIWTKQNRLDLVLPGITLAGQEKNSTMSSPKSFLAFDDILPGWSIEVAAANTLCNSNLGPLEAFRLHCDTGSMILKLN